jgi:transportin-3
MTSNQHGSAAFAPVLAALSTMQSNSPRPQKAQAHEYLEKFQKSVRYELWEIDRATN